MDAYRPFPSFHEWAQQANGMQAFDLVSAQYLEFSTEQRERFRTESTRSAAVDTNAIEGVFTSDRGFTYTVATMAHGWEQEVEDKGAHVRPAFDAAMEGYNLALDAATGQARLTEAFIRQLHETVMHSQDSFEVITAAGRQLQELPKGVYKTRPNYPTRPDGTVHYYASPDDTPAEMARLVAECSTEEFDKAHPVVQASYIHYAFVCVHPFADGNGRVSRALASIYLYRRPGVPFVVFNDEKLRYYDALEAADRGIYRPFIDFVEQRTVDAMNRAMDDFDKAVPTVPTLNADPTALRIADMAFTALDHQCAQLAGAGQFRVSAVRTAAFLPDPASDYSPAPQVAGMTAMILLNGGQLLSSMHAAVHTSPTSAAPYALMSQSLQPVDRPAPRPLLIFPHEVQPVTSETFQRRIDSWAQRFVATLSQHAATGNGNPPPQPSQNR